MQWLIDSFYEALFVLVPKILFYLSEISLSALPKRTVHGSWMMTRDAIGKANVIFRCPNSFPWKMTVNTNKSTKAE